MFCEASKVNQPLNVWNLSEDLEGYECFTMPVVLATHPRNGRLKIQKGCLNFSDIHGRCR
jgi:hypothetical protein